MIPVGIVIIGRNEGERLATCLNSIRASVDANVVDVVYVDSNSTDNSCEIALAYRANVIQLDTSIPFTAARARNAGAKVLLERHPEAKYLQFLDGDTELDPRWIARAVDYLEHHFRVAAACGRRRERFPAASIYNLMTDMEWNTPCGPAGEFGGDVLLRADVFQKLGGYNPGFIAGEEPEFAARMRLNQWQIARLDHEMTLHDLDMHHFSQWFRRTLRSGHAIAQLHHAHGRSQLRLYHKPLRSTLAWTVAIPPVIVLLAALTTWWMLLLLPLGYTVLFLRIMRHRMQRRDPAGHAALYAAFCIVAKVPQLMGMLAFYRNRLANRPSTIIEYKPVPGSPQKGSAYSTATS